MEEDIKILKDMISEYKRLKDIDGYRYMGKWQQAIEKLLKAYKELKKENKKMAEEYLVNNPGMTKYLNENYMLKSKIKEKLEEYKVKENCKKGKYCNNCCEYYARCKTLQSLLEEE